jgi:prophage DNA circulation protein
MWEDNNTIDFDDDELLDIETDKVFKPKSENEVIIEKLDELKSLALTLNKNIGTVNNNIQALHNSIKTVNNNVKIINNNVDNFTSIEQNRPVMKAYSKEELYLLHESGHSYADLAKVTGLNKETVRYRINSYIANKNK